MLIKPILSIALSLLIQTSYAQWIELTSNTTYDLNDVFFSSNTHGMAVGESGRILSTINGGISWTEAEAIPNCDLQKIFFVNADMAWVASSCGIHSSTDGGITWTLQNSSNGRIMHDIFFHDSQIGWSVGENLTIMNTIDGGTNWTETTLDSSTPNNPLLAVYFKDQSNGWVGGGEKLHFTTDGGETWTQGGSLLIDWIYDIDFGNETSGVAAGMLGSVTNTPDWGENWNYDGSVTPNSEYIYGVDFASENLVYLVGASGLIYFSDSEDPSWALQSSGVSEDLKSVHFPSSKVGYAVGDSGTIIKFGETVGVSEQKTSLNVVIYPNPTINNISVRSSIKNVENTRIQIIDVSGRIVLNQNLDYTRSLDISILKSGTYTIRIENKGDVQTKMFVKK